MANIMVKANIAENRLYVTISGILTMEDNQQYITLLHSELKKLKKGFTCLQDLREFNVLDPAVAKKAEGNKKIVESFGISKNAMVVSSAVLKGQMKRTFNNSDAGIEDKFFDNMEDAIKYLNS